MTIPFYKPALGPDEIAEVVDTLESGWLTTGPKTKRFESEFAAYLGQKHAVALNSCTAALHLALDAIGLRPGEGVLVPTMTFAATAEVVRYLGGVPILADCRESDFNLDVRDAERQIVAAQARGVEVKAIIPVHYGGQIGDVEGVAALAKQHGLKVIEDAAHCCPAFFRDNGTTGPQDQGTKGLKDQEAKGRNDHGTTGQRDQGTEGLKDHGAKGRRDNGTTGPRDRSTPLPGPLPDRSGEGEGSSTPLPGPLPDRSGEGDWRPVGSGADITCFSFYANKCMTTGEGGMACTNNEAYADRMRIMSLHGISRDAWKRFTAEGSWYYEIIAPGYKYNLTDIAAAIGIHQLKKADLFLQQRTALAARYTGLLGDIDEIILPRAHPDRIHSWHLYAIRLRLDRLTIDRAQFIEELKRRGIGTSVHWLPLHMHPYYRETYGYKAEDLPIAASLYPQLVTLPLYPGMTEKDVTYVCDSIREILAANRWNVRPANAETLKR